MPSFVRQIIFTLLLSLSSNAALTRSELVAHALANNPELRAARYEVAKAEARHRGSGLLSNPAVETEISLDHPFPSSERQMEASLTLSQSFPMTARLRLAKRVTAVQIEVAKAEIANRQRLLAGAVEQYFVEIQALEEQIALRSKQQRVVSELSAFIGDKHTAGEMTLAEALQSELEARTLGQEVTQLVIERDRQIANLKFLLGADPEVGIALEGGMEIDPVDTDLAEALRRRGDVRAAELEIQMAEGEEALERAKKWEDVRAGVTLANERTVDEPSGRGNEWFAGVGLSIPIPWWNDNRHAVEEKRALRAQTVVKRAGLIRRVRGELISARAQAAAYREMLGSELMATRRLAEQNLAAQENAYKAGQGQLINVLRAREQLLTLEETTLQARRNLALALIELRTASANNLP